MLANLGGKECLVAEGVRSVVNVEGPNANRRRSCRGTPIQYAVEIGNAMSPWRAREDLYAKYAGWTKAKIPGEGVDV